MNLWPLVNLYVATHMFGDDCDSNRPTEKCATCAHYRGYREKCREGHYDAGTRDYCYDHEEK